MWRFWFGKQNREKDLEQELRSDLELEAEELEEDGLSAEEARFAARRAFGNTSLIKEDIRATRRGAWIEDFIKDIRYAGRDLRKSLGFTATVVLSLALGIGVNTAIFTIIDAVLLKSLPVRDPKGLVVLGPARGSGSESGIPRDGSFSLYSYDLYKHLQNSRVFTALAAVQSTTQTEVSVRRAGWREAEPGQARLVSGNYFDVLGLNASRGRTITPSDDSAAATPVAVVSFQYWRNKLDAAASVIGSNIYIGGTPFTIVGVAPPAFYGETLRADPPDLWLPLSADRQLNRDHALIDQPDEHWLYPIGRLASGISAGQAQTQLTSALRNWLFMRAGSRLSAEDRAEISRSHIELTRGGSGILHMQRNYSFTLQLLLGISIAVLLITCANVANLLLARGAARAAETSVRVALGASRWRLMRQLLTESLTLALAGGALGLFLASWGTKLLIALFFRGTSYVPIETAPDLRVLAFTFVLSCAAALVFGLLPAIRMTSRIAPVIKAAGTRIKGSRTPARYLGLQPALIVAEVALSLIVLAGAGSFARSLANASGQQFGFDRERLFLANIDTAHTGYQDSRLRSLYRDLYSRLISIPGVKNASFSDFSPFNDCCWAFSVSIQGYTPKPGEQMHTLLNRVSPGYFQTLRTKLMLGRTFDERDWPASQRIAVVNQEFVRRFLANENPIGARFGIGGPRHAGDLEIIGVVANAKYDSPREDLLPMAFFPFLQPLDNETAVSSDDSNFAHVIEMRSTGQPQTIAADVRRVLAEIAPGIAVLRVSTMSDDIDLMLNQENVVAALATFFGIVALVLSCLGLYGLTAYTVQRRTSEIGIRIALGARRASVVKMVIKEALAQGLAGVALGTPAAIATIRLVSHQLYGVSPNDPEYSVAAALILLICIVAAAYAPALRAARVDPLRALRYE